MVAEGANFNDSTTPNVWLVNFLSLGTLRVTKRLFAYLLSRWENFLRE